ncbi:MAG: hypothetical protein AAB512_00790 [Patescibacteria group bacterium]
MPDSPETAQAVQPLPDLTRAIGDEEPHRISFEKYSEEITRNVELSNDSAQEITALYASAYEQHQSKGLNDYCLLSNDLGQRITDMPPNHPDRPNLLKVAAQAFEFAFEEEGPYKINRHIYAGNLIGAVHDVYTASDANFKKSDLDWMMGKKRVLDEAAETVSHWHNHLLYQEAYESGKSKGVRLDWADEERKGELLNMEHQIELRKKVASILTIFNSP